MAMSETNATAASSASAALNVAQVHPEVREADRDAHRSLYVLPNELLYNITTHLNAGDLYRLCLVSKKVAPIVQGALHIKPRTVCSCGDYGDRSRIMCLARTLASRSDLSHAVRELHLIVAPKPIVLQPTSHTSTTDSNTPYITWVHEMDVVGRMLQHVAGLQHLNLHVFTCGDGQGLDPNDYGHFKIEYSGDQGLSVWSSDTGFDLSIIPGLKTLRGLWMNGTRLDWAWCRLPHLKHLTLGHHCEIKLHEQLAPTSPIEYLEIERFADILFSADIYDAGFGNILVHLFNLRRLSIILCNVSYDNGRFPFLLRRGRQSHFDVLLDKLDPVKSTLEQLTIRACDLHDSFDFLLLVKPLTTLVAFEHLRVLQIPYAAIIHRKLPIDAIFPISLEELGIYTPETGMVDFLQEFIVHKEHFHRLLRIDLFPRSLLGGDDYEEFAFRYRPIWGQLRKAGLSIYIWWHRSEYREEWVDEDYDPFVCEIVEALNTLKDREDSNAVIRYITSMSI